MYRRRREDRNQWDTVALRIAILAFLPIVAVGTVSVVLFSSQTRPAVVAEFEHELQEALHLKSYATDMWVRQQMELIRWIGRGGTANSLEPTLLAAQSQTFIENFSQFRALVYVAEDGTVVLDSAGRSGGSVADRTYFQQAVEGNTIITVLRSGRTAADAYIIVAAPIVSGSNYRGVVFGALSPTVLETVMAGGAASPEMVVQLADENAKLVATLAPEGVEFQGNLMQDGGNSPNAVTRSAGTVTESGALLFEDKTGRRQLLALREIPSIGWVVAAQTPVASITRVVSSYNRSLLITLGLMIVMVAAIAVIVIYTLERPLFRLDRMSREISNGNYTDVAMIPAPTKAPVELRRLYRTIQDMALLVGTRQRTLEHESLTDPLTGIANRRRLEAEGAALIRGCCLAGHRYAVCMADIDRFKKINDTYGHSAGDAILCEVAALIRAELRSGDLLARYGGEEFAAIMPRIDGPQAAVIAERIRRSVERHRFATETGTLSITISLGIADATSAGCADAEDAPLSVSLAAADAQLYAAKQAGRNRVCADVHAGS